MSKLHIYCVTNKRLPFLEESSYKLCSVGKEFLHDKYLNSNSLKNIFEKEKYYSELTFHYWYWKNLMDINSSDWIGFCQKRRFWIKKDSANKEINKNNLLQHMLVNKDPSWDNYEAIICKPIKVSGVKKIKIIKRGWKNILKNPNIFFDEKKQTIKFHFDMHHGYNNLDKAIDLINERDRDNFRRYVNSECQYNPHIMVISKPKILNRWFEDLFEWLIKCEEMFGFKDLKGYDTQRIYAYLAERYLSYWFRNNSNFLEWPWTFVDD